MGWMQTLAETYDKCKSEVGKINYNDKGQLVVLLPIAHSINNAELEIMLDEKSNIIDVRKLGKEEQQTIMPVTEDSQARSSGVAPMPLYDNITYIAGDFKKFSDDVKKNERYSSYIAELKKWAEDPKSHKDIKVVYAYLKKGTLINDLMTKKVFDNVEDIINMQGMIRFKVKYNNNDLVIPPFENKEVFNNYIEYFNRIISNGKIDIDYISGKEDYIAQKLPSKIRNTADNARLISSNDIQGYTYRGRFLTADEVTTLSFELSQKAHNSLRWLIQKQGYRNGSEVIVVFGVESETKIRNPLIEDFILPLNEEIDTNEKYAKCINESIKGFYPLNKTDREKVVVIAVDTSDGASQGRLAITYYNEFSKSEFRDNIEKWYNEFAWILRFKDEYFKGTPNIKDIVNVAYGVQGSEKYLSVTNDSFFKKTIDRLLPCIVQHKRIPKDIVISAVEKLNNPLSTDDNLFDIKLRVTCALIRKYYIDYKKEVIEMALDKEKTDRSYLFGRLLALTDDIESYAIYKEGSARETNAKRYWSMFKRKPASTYELLREKIQSYLNKLHGGITNKYETEVLQIMEMLSESNSFNNNQLNEQYILGYYLQMDELKNNRKKNNEMEESENE